MEWFGCKKSMEKGIYVHGMDIWLVAWVDLALGVGLLETGWIFGLWMARTRRYPCCILFISLLQ